MNVKEFSQILDQEINFSQTSPLIKELDHQFIHGFVEGLYQAKYLLQKYKTTNTLHTVLDVLKSECRCLFISGKRACGKTTVLIDAVNYISENYANYRDLIITPTMADAKRLAEKICENGKYTYDENYNILRNTVNGYSVDICGSEDPHRFRGRQSSVVFIDNIESINKNTLETVAFDLRNYPTKLIVTGERLPNNFEFYYPAQTLSIIRID